mgnify:CR=1 FL=1
MLQGDVLEPFWSLPGKRWTIKNVFVGDFFYRGNLIIIDHGNGIISTYSHLNETFVSEGDKVVKNSKIGTVGSSGRVTGPHLHFEIILLGTKVNPILFL